MSGGETLLEWQHAGVHYSLQPIADHQVLLVAIGPGAEVRVQQEAVTNGAIAEWLTMAEPARSARAEALLPR